MKFLLAMAALAISVTMFTGCKKDEAPLPVKVKASMVMGSGGEEPPVPPPPPPHK